MKGNPKGLGFSTRAIHAGQPPEASTGSVAVPIFQTSTYVHGALGESGGYEYARVQNPTREALEANIAALEGGPHGSAFASGMAAASTLFSWLREGEHMVASSDVYGGTYRLLTQVLDRQGLAVDWVDTTNPDTIAAAMRPETRLVYIETPTNPLMEITDIAAAADIAHRHGARLAVDNTFHSPYLQRPLEHGADVVLHSATKYLNGHSDSLGGLLVTSDDELGEWFKFVQKSAGAILGPMDCFLILRGIKTLPVRMDRHLQNAEAIAGMLVAHPRVERVLYPGLPDHPGYEVNARQASGAGAMISFDVGSLEAAAAVLGRVSVASLAESLGGVETLISHPATMTHASIPCERRQAAGLSDGLVRISVGIEDVDDLLADLGQALDSLESLGVAEPAEAGLVAG